MKLPHPINGTPRLRPPTDTVWQCADGRRVLLHDMSDGHLQRAIRLIRRSVERFRWATLLDMAAFESTLSGEMAQDAIAHEQRMLELTPQCVLAEDLLQCKVFANMLRELERRGLPELPAPPDAEGFPS